MSTSVTVSSSLLEDIFRLLEYLDMRGNHDVLHFQKSGYSCRFEHDNALWELKIKIRQLQCQVVETYLLTFDEITKCEKRDLQQWIAAGNSIYDNPYSIYSSSGCPMDFINGCRLGIEMAEDPSSFFGVDPDCPDYVDDDDWDDDLPF